MAGGWKRRCWFSIYFFFFPPPDGMFLLNLSPLSLLKNLWKISSSFRLHFLRVIIFIFKIDRFENEDNCFLAILVILYVYLIDYYCDFTLF